MWQSSSGGSIDATSASSDRSGSTGGSSRSAAYVGGRGGGRFLTATGLRCDGGDTRDGVLEIQPGRFFPREYRNAPRINRLRVRQHDRQTPG